MDKGEGSIMVWVPPADTLRVRSLMVRKDLG